MGCTCHGHTHDLLPAACCLLPAASCQLPAVCSLLPTLYCLLLTPLSQATHDHVLTMYSWRLLVRGEKLLGHFYRGGQLGLWWSVQVVSDE